MATWVLSPFRGGDRNSNLHADAGTESANSAIEGPAGESIHDRSDHHGDSLSLNGHSNHSQASTGRLVDGHGAPEGDLSPVRLPPFSSTIRTPPCKLYALPIDSLHSIASFLSPTEWRNVGETNRTGHRICREVFRRARLHGFKCATEVVTAWKLGQWADARELAALYIQSGVPIYPKSLGHSYHTVLWRMEVEAKQMEGEQFFHERSEVAEQAEAPEPQSYLEEKAVFYLKADASSSLSQSRRQREEEVDGEDGPVATVAAGRTTKIPLKVHHHLLNQHMGGRVAVDDENGEMVTPPFSLSADFYHPSKRELGGTAEHEAQPALTLPFLGATDDIEYNGSDRSSGGERENADSEGSDTLQHEGFPELHHMFEDEMDSVYHLAAGIQRLERRYARLPANRVKAALSYVDVEPYSASSPAGRNVDGASELKTHLMSRFTTYQRRLETCLAETNNSGFEECVLDFWDEFFPHSALIHYYDMNTAVPRVSSLEKFLTKPCPKSIGVVQCEIERIKTNSKGKGGMKGRLFPTYEYRLFIRNNSNSVPPESAEAEPDNFTRRDTVLMVAKNKGRNNADGRRSSSSSRKGSNNYYLYMPQQVDVDLHFNKVNDPEHPAYMNPNGASPDPVLVFDDSGSPLLGRLQSNFIGTEFHILTPHLRKRSTLRPPPPFSALSDDDLDYDSGFSSDTGSPRRSRFGRLSLRRGNNPSLHDNCGMSDASSVASLPKRRTKSCPPPERRYSRSSRRAIAHTPEPQSMDDSVSVEEVNGVITYTANLLGSRPRIMDVCLPKVSDDGVPGSEWRQYLDKLEDPLEDGRMLRCLRKLQQRGDDAEEPMNDVMSVGSDDATSVPEDFGLLALQNRPPWWNIELGSFVLNFGGRVSVASVKNFQLCKRNDPDNIMLQFGRIQGRHAFTMDFQHPLTAVQAFAIAISSLQSKISFG